MSIEKNIQHPVSLLLSAFTEDGLVEDPVLAGPVDEYPNTQIYVEDELYATAWRREEGVADNRGVAEDEDGLQNGTTGLPVGSILVSHYQNSVPNDFIEGVAMSLTNRVLICIGILVVDLAIFFLPLTALFLIYIIFCNPPWFRDFLKSLDKKSD